MGTMGAKLFGVKTAMVNPLFEPLEPFYIRQWSSRVYEFSILSQHSSLSKVIAEARRFKRRILAEMLENKMEELVTVQ